jgi:F0F1-type ATP synthase membrane subunit b/b'
MKKLFPLFAALLAVTILFSVAGCSSVYYAAYEKVGVYKRDLLKKRVVEARDDQKEAQTQFKDALTRLKEITKFDGSQAESAYRALKSEYDDCVKQADVVHGRVRAVESVSTDLFAEWEKEIGEISTPSLQSASRQQLTATRQRYNELHTALVSAEQTMSPVLKQFNDYVLFLKHNLNAQAIASLKGEAAGITTEINRLIEQMNKSIARADEFVKTMQ